MAARRYTSPRTWVADDGEWPDGPFVRDAPPYALVTAAIVRHYVAAVGARSLRSVAREAGIDPTSLGRTLAGETVPDVHTVAVLEYALDVPLWPVLAERRPTSRYAITLGELEGSAHVPAADQVVEIPGQVPGRVPGDDDLGRAQRDALRAGG
jgi:DNA-binding phage protein